MIIEPYADHQGHAKNLAGQHKGNLYCTDCQVRVAEREVTEAELSASVPVVAVVSAEANTIKVRNRLLLRAYRTKAKTGMDISRVFRATIKGFNAEYGQTCKTWADVLIRADEMLKDGE